MAGFAARFARSVLRLGITTGSIRIAGVESGGDTAREMLEAGIGHIGPYRDEETLRPVSYFCRLPVNLAQAEVLLLDPMLATGNSACEAVAMLKAGGARRIQFICLVSCPVGIDQLHRAHPDVPLTTAVIDPELNEFAFIVPGLGDVGDRYFGTG